MAARGLESVEAAFDYLLESAREDEWEVEVDREELDRVLGERIAQLDAGEFITLEQLKEGLEQRKQEWRERQGRS